MRRPAKNLDLSLEFADLRDAVDGVIRVARDLRDPGALGPGDQAQTVECVLVLLRFLADRLLTLAAVARGDADPATLVTTGNRAGPGSVGVVLRAWSPARRLVEAAREVERLKRAGRWRR